MSQLLLEDLLSAEVAASCSHDSLSPNLISASSVGLSGALWELGHWQCEAGNTSRTSGGDWVVRTSEPFLNEETRTFTRSTWLCITHKDASPAPGRSLSGVREATENLLAEEGIETSLEEATLHRLRLARDFMLPFPAQACRATVRLFCSRQTPVRWGARVLESNRHEQAYTRCRVTACLSGCETISALLTRRDALEKLWCHLVKEHPPCCSSTSTGQVMAPKVLLHLASNSESAQIGRGLLLALGVWSDPVFTPRRIAGRLPDEAQLWNLEEERASRNRVKSGTQKRA